VPRLRRGILVELAKISNCDGSAMQSL